MTEAARRDGVSIGVTDSYRSYGEQVDLARRKGLYSQGGLAAKPGTSDHGWGLSLDLDLEHQGAGLDAPERRRVRVRRERAARAVALDLPAQRLIRPPR